ncbi:hypothetical protein [Sphingomonas sp. ACRSK]|uniref:hypothetical protein n=1 Tax=Sphingomonas sp. ACRSK TaxID=2918213 RepID=UPI001EF5DA6B|nr:hypothetical protein [Sphingomonas sp. ACRSK]MCG7348955.1 hypothetical protein [Sphingomonas sp. ACRSK]
MIPQFIRKLFDTHGEDHALWCGYDPGSSPGDMLIIEEGQAPPPPRPPKPRVRMLPIGWIKHMGGPFPFDKRLPVEIILADGLHITGRDVEHAGYWPDDWWQGHASSWKRNIRFYRFVEWPLPALRRSDGNQPESDHG